MDNTKKIKIPENVLINLYAGIPYWKIPKSFIKELGLHCSLYLTNLIYQCELAYEKNKMDSEDYFPCSQTLIEKDTCISNYLQQRIQKKLINKKYISIKELQTTNYFKINIQEFFHLFGE